MSMQSRGRLDLRILQLGIGLLLCAGSAGAHPGIGIVMDRKGNVFFTDLKQVWRLTPEGKKDVAVHDVHTHELSIDPQDTLFGEHLWYEGDATKTWGHRVWRRAPDGTLTDAIPARKGFREDYGDCSFVRDTSGTMYWADRGNPTVIRKRLSGGRVDVIARANFRDVRWMTVTPDGVVYLMDLYDLVRITSDGAVRTLARGLPGENWKHRSDRHAVMGLWTDPQENVYAAVPANREVKKVAPDGTVTVVARTSAPWSPSGGLVAPNGDLWLLEYSATNAVRLRRITPRGIITVFD
jgi:hypothetical protein